MTFLRLAPPNTELPFLPASASIEQGIALAANSPVLIAGDVTSFDIGTLRRQSHMGVPA